jgi:hypothetical protein
MMPSLQRRITRGSNIIELQRGEKLGGNNRPTLTLLGAFNLFSPGFANFFSGSMRAHGGD